MNLHTIRVWDLATRVFHWGLTVSVSAAIIAVKLGDDWLQWHFRCGYAVLTLLLFRIIWGFTGPRYARFTAFASAPEKIARYARHLVSREADPVVGHNPLGGISIFLMLGVLLFQAVTGLFSNDEHDALAPLATLLSRTLSDTVADVHRANATVVYIVLAVHVLAILFYAIRKRQNLTHPMIFGDTSLILEPNEPPPEPAQDDARTRIRALLLFILCIALVAAAVNWLPQIKRP